MEPREFIAYALASVQGGLQPSRVSRNQHLWTQLTICNSLVEEGKVNKPQVLSKLTAQHRITLGELPRSTDESSLGDWHIQPGWHTASTGDL